MKIEGIKRQGMNARFLMTLLFLGLIFVCSERAQAQQQNYYISSGGLPTITGGLNGTVAGTSDVTQNLSVTVNFGELSPANLNRVVKVVIPIAIRSIQPYQVSASAAATFNGNPLSVQATDVGFGIQNMRPLGNKAQICTKSSHQISALFNNDPASSATINSAGRVAYPSTVSNVSGSGVILMTGPKLTQATSISRTTVDGWVFDAVFVITPSFYATGNFSVTFTFSIAPGPIVLC